MEIVKIKELDKANLELKYILLTTLFFCIIRAGILISFKLLK